ncbi:uncharacterized protein LOC111713001 isoform X2 [Eurytemora carolleeae]|uniref:uncharacterized protein LOC111713001 isoform X2 n=1 Tax=Eurytemora carolleeae TaxID=1294199 RepID=UPI000C7836F3|nr:uncharacterized protein LOC111713001 isoform X2 [Eurytemora carolleeae]|eukprot:XP_023343544.1 uncharacterized protein LOC111713001 isoform X2 [Eurytemora affinis]
MAKKLHFNFLNLKQLKNQFLLTTALLILILVFSHHQLVLVPLPTGFVMVNNPTNCSLINKFNLDKDMKTVMLLSNPKSESASKGKLVYRPYLNCLGQEDDHLAKKIRKNISGKDYIDAASSLIFVNYLK